VFGWVLSFDSSGKRPSKQLTARSAELHLKMQ